jgi:hypothetical protein
MTDLPYAADAEVSLSYDELEVRTSPRSPRVRPADARSARARSSGCSTRRSRHRRMSPSKRSSTTPGGSSRRPPARSTSRASASCRTSTAPSPRAGASASTTSPSATTRWRTTTRRASSTVRARAGRCGEGADGVATRTVAAEGAGKHAGAEPRRADRPEGRTRFVASYPRPLPPLTFGLSLPFPLPLPADSRTQRATSGWRLPAQRP